MKRIFVFILAVLTLLIPRIVFSQAIPLENLSLRLVPRDPQADDVAAKTITIQKTPLGFRLTWYSLTKDFDEQAHYPTYKVRANKGVVDIDGFDQQEIFFHPSLWGQGYIRSEQALPLWVGPGYFDLKGKQTRPFNIGLLNMNRHLLKGTPDAVYDQVSFFQNLYDQYVEGATLKAGLNLKKADERGIKNFIEDFFVIKRIAQTSTELYVNQKRETYPSVIFGNDYFQFVTIDDPLNPLMVSLRIIPDKVPEPFRESFNQFKKNFEFRITQVNY